MVRSRLAAAGAVLVSRGVDSRGTGAVESIIYEPDQPYRVKLQDRQHKCAATASELTQDVDIRPCDVVDTLVGKVREQFATQSSQFGSYREDLFSREKNERDIVQEARVAELRRGIHGSSQSQKNVGSKQRKGLLDDIFGFFDEAANVSAQAEKEKWAEAQKRLDERRKKRHERQKRSRRMEDETNAYTDDHYRGKLLQVDREVAAARQLLDVMGGKIQAVGGRRGSAGEHSLVNEAMKRGKELHEAAWMPRKDDMTRFKDG